MQLTKKQKWFLRIVIIVILLATFCALGYADDTIVGKAQNAKEKVIGVIEELAKVAAVVFIAWAGVIWWGAGGDAQKMAAAKSKLLWFFIALFLIFGAQGISDSIIEMVK